jgi:hypothetical protein
MISFLYYILIKVIQYKLNVFFLMLHIRCIFTAYLIGNLDIFTCMYVNVNFQVFKCNKFRELFINNEVFTK